MKTAIYSQLVQDLKSAGIESGDNVLIHSALTPIGYHDGGAKTVAQALRGEETYVYANFDELTFATEYDEAVIRSVVKVKL